MIGINAQQANQNKRNDLVIFDEQTAIMRSIITNSNAGSCEISLKDTTMTKTTATITITGTQANPTIVPGTTVIFESTTVTLGTSGSNLNAVIADINDAGIANLTASKNSSNQLVLTYVAPEAAQWTFEVGAGTANGVLGLTAATTTATNPSSVDYFNVWQGNTSDSCSAEDITAVIDHFRNLGYTIEQRTNNSTGKTFYWQISY